MRRDERLHVRIDFKTLDWHFRYWHNDADFYDLSGPTKRSRKGDAFIAGYRKLIVYDEPRRFGWSADVAYYTGLDTLPENQNVASQFDDAGQRGDRPGIQQHAQVAGQRRPRKRRATGPRLRPPTTPTARPSRSSTAASISASRCPGQFLDLAVQRRRHAPAATQRQPFANFYFGGFGNNYVDKRAVKRYREYQTFPGLRDRRARRPALRQSVLEWNAPPFRFEEIGIPASTSSYIRPAVFAGALVVDDSLAGGAAPLP